MHRILLIEDDADVGTLLEHALVSAGYRVSRVTTRQAAAPLLAERSHALLLADLSLPDGNGIDLADEAKALGMKTLLITGDALRVPAAQLERHEYVLKPTRPRELLAAIERVLAAKPPPTD